MKERPILFNAEMVKAIISGRKTQTRRVLKVQPDEDGLLLFLPSSRWLDTSEREYNCPFGNVGDQLWVRETWQGPLVDYDDAYSMFKDPTPYQKVENCVYKADGGPCPEFTDADDELRYGWKASIHMPRWASRIDLLITGVRVERLNDISEEDARDEGVKPAGDMLPNYPDTFLTPNGDFATAHVAFKRLWESIYGADNWQANPWVWVIEFEHLRAGGQE